jgi:hypothetical protein
VTLDRHPELVNRSDVLETVRNPAETDDDPVHIISSRRDALGRPRLVLFCVFLAFSQVLDLGVEAQLAI